MEGLPLMKVKGKVTKTLRLGLARGGHQAQCQVWAAVPAVVQILATGDQAGQAECYFNQLSIVTCGAKDMRILGHDTPAMPAWIMSFGSDTVPAGQG